MIRTALIAAIFAAFAGAEAEAADFVFHYNAGALASNAGTASTYDRLIDRSEAACNIDDVRGIAARRAARTCAVDLVEIVVDEIGDARLAAQHAAQADEIELSAR